jgi:aspartokinase
MSVPRPSENDDNTRNATLYLPANSTDLICNILDDSTHTKARIKRIDDAKIHADLNAGKVVVVAGFQGVDEHGNITTLGRGGSDTTAVALAAALKADECHISHLATSV